ncbi:MAG: hypothetical protein KatS3mg110_2749 [Pirellulaceae bacterium]|nr:MAG: hypothetical protein KatS3mg110_2749 [Pirellulaceae bacterium]
MGGSPPGSSWAAWAAACGPSRYGWCGVIAGQNGIVAVRFAEPTQSAVRRWIEYRASDLMNDSCGPGDRLDGGTEWEAMRLARQVVQAVQDYLNGVVLDLAQYPLDWPLVARTAFDREVWEACRTIGYGQVMTYGELAERVGRPRAARAVGGAMRRNPVPLLVPCHRVLGSGGRLTGYSARGGVELKQMLLQMERAACCGH